MEGGNVVIPNLTRCLMSIIRYPMGDAAEWVDYGSRKIRPYGRGAVGVMVGLALYDRASLEEIVSNSWKDGKVNGFQVLLRRAQRMDEMVFRIACQPGNPEEVSREVQEEMNMVHGEGAKEVAERFVKPLVIGWVSV